MVEIGIKGHQETIVTNVNVATNVGSGSVKDVLMPQDLAMKFMIWSGYFNGLNLETGKSFARFGKFTPSDAERLDRLQTVLFRCFEPASAAASMKSLKQAKQRNEPCPFSEESLNELFGKVK